MITIVQSVHVLYRVSDDVFINLLLHSFHSSFPFHYNFTRQLFSVMFSVLMTTMWKLLRLTRITIYVIAMVVQCCSPCTRSSCTCTSKITPITCNERKSERNKRKIMLSQDVSKFHACAESRFWQKF